MRIKSASASFTRPSDTNAYTIGDVVNNDVDAADVVPLTFDGAARGGGVIVGARLSTSAEACVALLRLHLFRDTPSGILGDNAVFKTMDANAEDYVGSIDFAALASGGAGSQTAETNKRDFRLAFAQGRPNSASNGSLYGVLEDRTGFTPVSAQTFRVELTLEV